MPLHLAPLWLSLRRQLQTVVMLQWVCSCLALTGAEAAWEAGTRLVSSSSRRGAEEEAQHVPRQVLHGLEEEGEKGRPDADGLGCQGPDGEFRVFLQGLEHCEGREQSRREPSLPAETPGPPSSLCQHHPSSSLARRSRLHHIFEEADGELPQLAGLLAGKRTEGAQHPAHETLQTAPSLLCGHLKRLLACLQFSPTLRVICYNSVLVSAGIELIFLSWEGVQPECQAQTGHWSVPYPVTLCSGYKAACRKTEDSSRSGALDAVENSCTLYEEHPYRSFFGGLFKLLLASLK
ncbi:uncharacterized protein LOC141917252 [Strix aluco]|uniref:uncharacterized protein LOC141917252 n=1 Tax=Strix aluco TaxID=111821 RepID=UPI003DA5BD70